MRLVPLTSTALLQLAAADAAGASLSLGIEIPPWYVDVDNVWLWELRAADVAVDPDALAWIARPVLVAGVVVGHAGFHGPPDDDGTVEVAYAVDPAHRGRGHARAALQLLLAEAAAAPDVRMVRASARPDNVVSLHIIEAAGFVPVGEQWDEVDGRELVFERRPTRS